jgi:uncharacterized phage protein gp47/JayE
MPFSRPTLIEIIERIQADMSSRLIGVEGSVLRRSLAGIIADTEAGSAHLLYGYIQWASEQAIPDTAETEYLDRWAQIWLPDGRLTGQFSSGNVEVTGTDGETVNENEILQRSDGQEFRVTADTTIAGGTASVPVLAVTQGIAGDTDAGTSLSFQQPIDNIDATATVEAPGLDGGVDPESDDRLRARLIQRIQEPPQGGSDADYILWALEVPGVTRVWVTPFGMGAGTVVVTFVTDDDPSGIIPSPAKIAEVQDYIDERRPVTATVFVVAPGEAVTDPSIQLTPNTSEVQAAVTAELEDLYRRDASPGGTIFISRFREAVSRAAGEENNVVTDPTADIVAPAGDIHILGTISFSAVP